MRISLIASLCLLIGLAGCSRDNRTTLRVALWSSGDELQINTKMMNEFKEKNPDINLKVSFIPSGNYRDKILTNLAGNAGPDVFLLGNGDFPAFCEGKVLRPIDDLAAKSKDFSLKDFHPKALAPFQRYGKTYAVPRDILPMSMLFYNKILFDKANVAYPTPKWTMDDLIAAATKLTVRDGDRTKIYGYYPTSKLVLNCAYGGNLVNSLENPTKSTVTDPRFKKGIELYYNMVYRDKIAPPDNDSRVLNGNPLDMFRSGKAAMMSGGVYLLTFFKDQRLVDLGYTLIPPVPGGKMTWTADSGAYCINARSKHPEAAWRFVKFITGEKAQEKMAKIDYLVPSRLALQKRMYIDSKDTKYGDRKIMIQSIDDVVQYPYTPKLGEVQTALGSEIDKFYLGQQDLDTTLSKAQKSMDKVLQRK